MSRRAVARTFVAALAVAGVLAAGSASYSAASSPSLPNQITVQPGDTLWALARANGVTVSELAAANGMSPNDLLLAGRELAIPTAGGTSSAGSGGPGTNFCATTTFATGPYGQIPSLLAASPARLALRPVMVQWADTYGVAPALVEAVAWQESGWQQSVVSPDGAVGIGQLLPATASFVDNDLVGANLNLNVASDNIRMEAVFLAYLIRQVGNNACEVAAAYYQGPAALAAYGVFPESEQYVRDVLALEAEFS